MREAQMPRRIVVQSQSMVENAAFVARLSIDLEVLVLRFSEDDRENSQKQFRLRISGGVHWRTCSVIWFVSWPILATGELVVFIVQSRHDGRDHFTFKTCKSPCLRSELHNSFHCNLDTFFFSWIGKMFDGVDDLLYDRSSSSVDALFSTRAREGCKKCLLTPDCFFPCTLLANVVAH